MLVGDTPFSASSTEGVFRRIRRDPVTYPRSMPSAAKDMLENFLLIRDPCKRAGNTTRSLSELADCRFFRSVDWARLADVKSPLRQCIRDRLAHQSSSSRSAGRSVAEPPDKRDPQLELLEERFDWPPQTTGRS
mmetsp:Transcript_38191/g.82740  ORF Transcript_38191/g.82740 Transcript_38191/m.82740 type:complete len:134 (+) Transcript_38191:1-402(+)